MRTKRRLVSRVAALSLAALSCLMVTVAASAATAVAPVNTAPPTVAGTAKVGETLTAGDGTWSNTPTSYAYQWLRCNGGGNACATIAGATKKTHMLVAADAEQTIRVRVAATNADGSASAESSQTAKVAAATSNAAPNNTAPPTISGTPKVGQVLTANDGSWSGNPSGYAYAWQRCEADVAACARAVAESMVLWISF